MKHIPRRIVMHVSNLSDVVVDRGQLELLLRQHLLGLALSPGEVVPIVIECEISVLGSVEATAFTVTQPCIHPCDRLPSDPGKGRVYKALKGSQVALQQLRVVVGHLLEVRHHPTLVHRVTMEASC